MDTMAWKPTPGTSPPNVLPSGHSQETVRFFPEHQEGILMSSRRAAPASLHAETGPASTRTSLFDPGAGLPVLRFLLPKRGCRAFRQHGNTRPLRREKRPEQEPRSLFAPCRPTEQARIRNVTAISGIPQKCDWQDRPFPVPATSAFPFRNRYRPHHG